MVIASVFFAFKLIINPRINFYLLGLMAAGYGAANTFIFKSNPRDIEITDKTISFISFGEDKYEIKRIKNFQVKEYANAQLYIRVAQDDGKKGRYWVSYYYFSEKEDLIKEMYFIENKVHPERAKFRGRKKLFAYRPGQAPEGWNENAGDNE